LINQSLRILFLVPYTPTLIRTRPYNLLGGLARRGHAVTLATLWENEADLQALQEFESLGVQVISHRLTRARSTWNMLRALPTNAPLQSAYCWQPQFLHNLQSAFRNQQVDILHVEHLRGARYGLALNSLLAARHSALSAHPSLLPTVWDSVDCISYLFEQAAEHSTSLFGRWVTRFELGRTRSYEAMLVSAFDRVLVTSNQDAAALSELNSTIKTHTHDSALSTRHSALGTRHSVDVLPNGVDLDYFSPPAAPRDPATLVFSGKMSYHANVTAALYLVNAIMPLVWRDRPTARVVIAGKDPSPSLRRMVLQDSRIRVTGTVPDIRPYLTGASVAVCPIQYGAGIQNKVLEPMACATPVVASPQAISALQAVPGQDLLVAEGAEATAREIVKLLGDPILQAKLGQAGRCYVEKNYPWTRVVEQLEGIYKETVDASAK
jgi:glycosyltransferase involved in cell wall biosynthesis